MSKRRRRPEESFNVLSKVLRSEGGKVRRAASGGVIPLKAAKKASEAGHRERLIVQRATYMVLRDQLADAEDLVDLFAGNAISTLALLLEGVVDRLVLVDSEYSNLDTKTEARYARSLIKKTKQEANVELLSEKLSADSAFSKAKVRDVTLLGTGFALDSSWRRDINEIHARSDFARVRNLPSIHRANHTAQKLTSMNLIDVQTLLDGPNQRLHIVETPFCETQPSHDDMKAYVESNVQTGWKLAKFMPMEPFLSFYARLERV